VAPLLAIVNKACVANCYLCQAGQFADIQEAPKSICKALEAAGLTGRRSKSVERGGAGPRRGWRARIREIRNSIPWAFPT